MNTKVILHNGSTFDPTNIVMVYEGRIDQPGPTERVLIEPDTGVVIATRQRARGWTGGSYWQVEVGQHKGASRLRVTVEPVINEHVILTALVVETTEERDAAMRWLGHWINDARQSRVDGDDHVNSWWFAEDDRNDGSDCESAVFIPVDFQKRISQDSARRILEAAYEVMDESGGTRGEGWRTVDEVCQVILNPDIYPEPEPEHFYCNARSCPVIEFVVELGRVNQCPGCSAAGSPEDV